MFRRHSIAASPYSGHSMPVYALAWNDKRSQIFASFHNVKTVWESIENRLLKKSLRHGQIKAESLLFYRKSAPEEFLRRAALARERPAVSASLSRILSFFLGGTRKKPPEGPSRNEDRAIGYSPAFQNSILPSSGRASFVSSFSGSPVIGCANSRRFARSSWVSKPFSREKAMDASLPY